MTPRARRWLAAAITVVMLLYSGRWLADFAASRWWAEAISPAAQAAVTRWQLLGLALDAGAVCLASVWFAVQGLLVARAIGTVQVQRRVGDELVRQQVPMRWLATGAAALGVLLGLFTGAGAATWRAPLLLALNAPHYGIDDPLLGVDLGTLVARYPLWRAAHGFVLVLVILGLVLVVGLYAGIGALKRREGRLELHPDARRHLAGLSALLALVIAAGYLLAPFRLATSIDVPLANAAASTRILAAHAAAGAALAAAGLSLGWLFRARVSLLLSGWLVLGLAAITERLVVPAFVAEAGSIAARAEWQRRMDSVFHHISLIPGAASPDTLPLVTSLWDEGAVMAWAAERGETVLALAPSGEEADAGWTLATSTDSQSNQIIVTRISAHGTDGGGHPIVSDSGHPAVDHPRSMPGSTGWAVVPEGIRVGSLLRPMALAWSQQAPGILGTSSSAHVDWARDPRDRVATLIPALDWRPLGLAQVGGRLVWLMSGMATVTRAPMATRVEFAGRTASGVVPSIVAIVVAETGDVSFYPDPSADPLGVAWQRAFGGLISPAADLPRDVVRSLGYPREWFDHQLVVLSQAHWGLGVVARPPGGSATAVPLAGWSPEPGALQQAMEDPERRNTLHLLTARREEGVAGIVVDRLPIGVPTAVQLAGAWRQMPAVEQLADSLRAAADTLVAGPIHWHHGAAGVFAWQPMHSGGRQGSLAMVWIGAASPLRMGGGRRSTAAWESVLTGSGNGVAGESVDELARIEAVRSWMRRADSALVRGDLTAFARAWEALRGLLLDSIPR
jgi:hypothetical protein